MELLSMAEIHHLPNRPRQSDPEDEIRKQKAEAIKRLIEERPGSLPGSRGHADFAGRELFRMFKDSDGDLKRRVCEVAFGTNARKPTKRLWGVLIDPDKPRAKVPLPAAKRKRLTIYLRLAEAFASVSGQAAADVILRVFPDVAPDAELESVHRERGIAEQLRDELWDSWLRANEMIIQDCDLRRALAVAMEFPIGGGGPYGRTRFEFNQVLGYIGEEEHRIGVYCLSGSPDDFIRGVAPSLFLGECHGPSFRAAVSPIETGGHVAAPIAEIGCWVRLWFRFWWSILPIGSQGDPRGCFLVSLCTERAPWPIPVEELDERDATKDGRSSGGPWTTVLGHEGARYDGHWTDRDLWQRRNAPGLVLAWNTEQHWSYDTTDFEGPWRCTAKLDADSRRAIRAVFGCEPEALPTDPIGILPPSTHWRDLIFSLPDAALADWVGPNPDYPRFHPPERQRLPHTASDEEEDAAEDMFSQKMDEWRDKEVGYQVRELGRDDEPLQLPLAFPRIREGTGTYPTIGSKFEESLLYLPESERPDMALRRRAELLRSHAVSVTGSAAAHRRAKLTALGRSAGTT